MKNYGFVQPKIEADQYIFGASPLSGLPDLLPSGDWRPYLPKYEAQADKYETYGCTVWGGQNQLEILLKFLYDVEHNFDEQFNYNDIGIEPPGTDPQLYYESQRKHFLTEGVFPLAQSLEDFKKPRPMTEEYLAEARKFGYIVGHEWLFTNNPTKEVRLNMLKTGLKKCPVAVSVTAWMQDSQGLYIDNGQPNTHWCVCVAIEDDCPIVFDSYDQRIKKLHPDHHIQVAKLIYVSEKEKGQPGLIKRLLTLIGQALGLTEKEVEQLPKPDTTYQEVKEEVMKPTYEWDTQEKARHSVRVICDEEGLTVQQKNELCATVGGESNWKPRAMGKPNKNGSRDYGIVQLNDHFWIGEGKLYPNIEAVYNDPEGCIRWMCKQWKVGKKNWWYAYKNGSYKQYLNPKFDNKGNLL